jgi:hypothetical protein
MEGSTIVADTAGANGASRYQRRVFHYSIMNDTRVGVQDVLAARLKGGRTILCVSPRPRDYAIFLDGKLVTLPNHLPVDASHFWALSLNRIHECSLAGTMLARRRT